MKASVTLFQSDGETSRGFPVKLVVSHKGKTVRRVVGYSSLTHWDMIRDIPLPVHPDYEGLYGFILSIRQMAISRRFLQVLNVDDAISELMGKKQESGIFVESYFKERIKQLRSEGRYGNADAYEYAMRQFVYYAPDLKFEDITPVFLEGFKRYKLQQCSEKTVKNYLGVLRSLYNYAVADPNIILVDTYPFKNVMKGFVIRRRRKKNRYLSPNELVKLAELWRNGNMSNVDRRVIGLSLIQFCLGGANLKDVYFLKRDRFFNDRVMMSRSKLGRLQEEYDLKVFPYAREIIDSLSGDHSVYLFPWEKTHVGYKTFSRNHRRSLSSIQERHEIVLSPINDNLGSNTFRHTFATLGKFEGVDPDIIRELMGHERNDIDTVYKDRYPEYIRDQAHEKIIGAILQK